MVDKQNFKAAESPAGGKIGAATFTDVILPRLGAWRPDVLVGPRHGVDAGIIDAGHGMVMAVTTDPFFVMPQLGWERAAWFAVHIVASDAATTGLPPAFCALDLNLPVSMSDDDFAELWDPIHRACARIGMAIVTGHTGRYDGCQFPMVGGATVMSIGARECYVAPHMAQAGDAVVVTKGAAIETTGMFGATFPQLLRERLGNETARAAAALFDSMSVVHDARIAASAGVRDDGVTGMHDATERGIWGGLVEIAETSGLGMVIDQGAILVRPETAAICDAFRIDPYTASSEGTLLLTCRPHRVGEVIARLDAEGIAATAVGEMTPEDEGVRVTRGGGEEPLERPVEDPFWPAYSRALAEYGGTDGR